MSYSAVVNESLISDSPSTSAPEEGDIHVQSTVDIPDVEKELPVMSEYSQVPEQAEPSFLNDCSYYGLDPDFTLQKDTNFIEMDDSFSSDNDCVSSNNDYSSSETETTSSDDSDLEDDEDQLQTTCSSDSVKEFTEKEKLSVLILSYIAKHKLNGSASVDLLDLLKLIVPEDNNLQSLTLTKLTKHLVTVSQTFMIIVESVFSSFQKMRALTNAAQLMVKEDNV